MRLGLVGGLLVSPLGVKLISEAGGLLGLGRGHWLISLRLGQLGQLLGLLLLLLLLLPLSQSLLLLLQVEGLQRLAASLMRLEAVVSSRVPSWSVSLAGWVVRLLLEWLLETSLLCSLEGRGKLLDESLVLGRLALVGTWLPLLS